MQAKKTRDLKRKDEKTREKISKIGYGKIYHIL